MISLSAALNPSNRCVRVSLKSLSGTGAVRALAEIYFRSAALDRDEVSIPIPLPDRRARKALLLSSFFSTSRLVIWSRLLSFSSIISKISFIPSFSIFVLLFSSCY
ncbi:MAG: hypothetical protein AABY44_09400 [Nitrospirota bacterium]